MDYLQINRIIKAEYQSKLILVDVSISKFQQEVISELLRNDYTFNTMNTKAVISAASALFLKHLRIKKFKEIIKQS
tara:strand:+ start:49 stop:276 length:228 start_codon:yes stop_codon:yes gene_type:complete